MFESPPPVDLREYKDKMDLDKSVWDDSEGREIRVGGHVRAYIFVSNEGSFDVGVDWAASGCGWGRPFIGYEKTYSKHLHHAINRFNELADKPRIRFEVTPSVEPTAAESTSGADGSEVEDLREFEESLHLDDVTYLEVEDDGREIRVGDTLQGWISLTDDSRFEVGVKIPKLGLGWNYPAVGYKRRFRNLSQAIGTFNAVTNKPEITFEIAPR